MIETIYKNIIRIISKIRETENQKLIVEGVESKEMVNWLNNHIKCRQQGYYHSKSYSLIQEEL